jgi:ferredoxin
MPRVTVKIDPSLCIAAANCVGMAPHLFQINEDALSEVVEAGQSRGYEHTMDVAEEDAELIDEAAESCPTRAIQAIRAE